METGLKTIQKTSHLEPHIKKELSIQISLSGLSFCILNRTQSQFEFLKSLPFKSKLTPETTLEALKKAIAENPPLTQAFDQVVVLFQNELNSLVPEALFEEANASDYLKFSSKIIKTDFISYDKIEHNQSINVFVPYVNINNHLFEIYGEFEYKHASSIFIEQVLKAEQGANDDKMYINVAPFHFEMVVVKQGQLQLYNSFDYDTKEDFLYFVLFTIEQLQLDPESLIVKLSGKIAENDPSYTLLYTYIRYIEFAVPVCPYNLNKIIPAQERSHQHSFILNSFN